jgi:hypothetical protein
MRVSGLRQCSHQLETGNTIPRSADALASRKGLLGNKRPAAQHYYGRGGEGLVGEWSIRCLLVRVCAQTRGIQHPLWVNVPVAFIHVTCRPVGRLREGLHQPRPIRIVFGAGAVTGDRVAIFHHVTSGRAAMEQHPTIVHDSWLSTCCRIPAADRMKSGWPVGAHKWRQAGRGAWPVEGRPMDSPR